MIRMIRVISVLMAFLMATSLHGEDIFRDKKYNINAKDSNVRDIIRLIGNRAGFVVKLDDNVDARVSYNFSKMTLSQILQRISKDKGYDYSLKNNVLYVTKAIATAEGATSSDPSAPGSPDGDPESARAPAQAPGSTEQPPAAPALGAPQPGGGGSIAPASATPAPGSSVSLDSLNIMQVKPKYIRAREVVEKLQGLLGAGEKVSVDENSNSLIIIGSQKTRERVLGVLKLIDRMPEQVLIEARIVESSDNFLRNIGIQYGFTQDTAFDSSNKLQGFVSTDGPASANTGIRYLIGEIGGTPLDIRLSMAEARGEAKVVSRPKIVTLNNQQATIDSGLTFHVKTLSTTSSGGETATGGVTTVQAGLNLTITPTIIGDDMVKLAIAINNSQPDEGSAVDGIPGILTNSAATSLVVKEGKTAIIAGLVTKQEGESHEGVPFLSSIPLIGLLFRNHNLSDRYNEMTIFMTPSKISSPEELNTRPASETERAIKVIRDIASEIPKIELPDGEIKSNDPPEELDEAIPLAPPPTEVEKSELREPAYDDRALFNHVDGAEDSPYEDLMKEEIDLKRSL